MSDLLETLASRMTLGDLLEAVRRLCGGYDLVQHHTQGEFHHDVVLRVHDARALPGAFLVVSTNCNGGVKEVLCTAEAPEIEGVWRWRCPENDEFRGTMPAILGVARTLHWFDPCELLAEDARSELRPEHRERQPGGGWRMCGKTSRS
ncbi:hypothetical protein [Sandaracinus amylolyticus]|uniref:Uncharacterized protein n=1 Tax=Sandaracinus amylolyticus TaxID=927083 RepID=A0A0F6YIS3_9BACT|nr:hypothetical protein [Sandaracinus amylolyticus]AKF07313.1 hypothetical protein DB32_004462 [Sandaracinus amylolyticus]